MASGIAIVLGGLFALCLLLIVSIVIIVPLVKGIGWLFSHLWTFVSGEISDILRLVGGVVVSALFVPLTVGSVLIGRWSSAVHYGRAIQSECTTFGKCLYRILVGHPARLLLLTPLLDGIEHRLPEVVAAAPGSDRPSHRTGQFDGYNIVGSLKGGGSGGKLYIAEPDAVRRAAFERTGVTDIDRVVIKSFSLHDGSSLPQIVRESRALDAAKKLGLVLDHDLGKDRFYYVMRFVPGDSLSLVTQRLHAESGSDGLDRAGLRNTLEYVRDLVRTLATYHAGGLWHKDVKPDNIIVDGRSAHLVDLGLVTPLRSAMTLTTHGTEYFRDPELVRLALKGVKVQDVDGAKFDIYAAAAVLYSLLENSFPAHGALSRISKKCPEVVKWIVRRGMTEYDKRYPSALDMLADLEFVLHAKDPFAVKPIDLPSMSGRGHGELDLPEPEVIPVELPKPEFPRHAHRLADAPPPPVVPEEPPSRTRPKLRVTNWWTGAYRVEDVQPTEPEFHPEDPLRAVRPQVVSVAARRQTGGRASADEQRRRARERVAAARERARGRLERRRGTRQTSRGGGIGVAIAILVFLAVCVLIAFSTLLIGSIQGRQSSLNEHSIVIDTPQPPETMTLEQGDEAWRETMFELLSSVHGLRLLVVNDFTPPFSDDVRHVTSGALGQFRLLGVEMIGNVPGQEKDETRTTFENELIASARYARGDARLESTTAHETITTWLESQQEHVDMLLWIGYGEEDPNQPSIQLYMAEGISARTKSQLVDGFRGLLRGVVGNSNDGRSE